MGRKGFLFKGVMLSALLLSFTASKNLTSSSAQPGLKTILPSCAFPGCHSAEPNTLRGNLVSVSMRAGLVQVNTGDVIEVFFDEGTQIKNWKESLSKVARGTPIKIVYTEKDGKRFATVISIKPPMTVPPEKRVYFDEVKKLWETKSALLIDVRPPAKHAEGYIPGSINIPLPKLESELPKLAPDKNTLIVFYCEGPR